MLNRLIKYIKFFWKSETLFVKRVSSMETNWKHYSMVNKTSESADETTSGKNDKEQLLAEDFLDEGRKSPDCNVSKKAAFSLLSIKKQANKALSSVSGFGVCAGLTSELLAEVEGFKANLRICVLFILSSLVGFLLLPDYFHVYYLQEMTGDKVLSRFDLTFFWLFISGFILSSHFAVLACLSGNLFSTKEANDLVVKIRHFLIFLFNGTWAALFYTQWDGLYYANTGKKIFENPNLSFLPVFIFFFTALLSALLAMKRKHHT